VLQGQVVGNGLFVQRHGRRGQPLRRKQGAEHSHRRPQRVALIAKRAGFQGTTHDGKWVQGGQAGKRWQRNTSVRSLSGGTGLEGSQQMAHVVNGKRILQQTAKQVRHMLREMRKVNHHVFTSIHGHCNAVHTKECSYTSSKLLPSQ